jgi:hypothetical protein
MREITEFLLTDAGAYQLSQAGDTLLFPTKVAAERFNAFSQALGRLVAQEEQLSADVAAYQAHSAEQMEGFMVE